MTLLEQQNHIDKLFEDMSYILFNKGSDYANEDRLSNFKLAGSIAGGDAASNCLNLIATKVARLGNLLSNKKAVYYESVNDSIIDLANYAVLLHMIVNEEKSCTGCVKDVVDSISESKVDSIELDPRNPLIYTDKKP